MKQKLFILWLMLLMGATGAYSAQADFNDSMLEPYAVLSTDNTSLTFYYDKKRNSRIGTTYDLNTGSYRPGWYSNCANITSVEFDSSFSDARPTTCVAWFHGCTILTSITGMEYLNTSQVTNMQNMFTNCHILASVDLSHFDTSNVELMTAMFSRCYNLAAIDVSHFDLSKVPDLMGMFNECTSLESLDISNFIIPYPHLYLGYGSLYLFNGCSKLKTLVVPATAYNLEANACSGVGTQDAPCTLVYPAGFTLEKTSEGDGWYKWKGGYFKDADPEPYAVLSTDNTSLTFYYDKKRNSRTGTTYDLNAGNYKPGWYTNCANITSVEFDSSFSDARPTTCLAWFNGCTILTSITGMEYLNTSQVTDMQNMFTNCHILASVDLSHFDTSNVENMAAMFSRCYNLAAIDVSHFDLSKVPNLLGMFNECTSLESLDVSNFIIPDPNSYFGYGSLYLFNGCSKLKTLVVPATANNLEANACSGVGTQDAPCILAYPVGFTPEQTDSGDGWYQWKGGFFKPYPKGDANHDNLVSIADVTLTVDYVLSLHPSNFFIESADVVPDGLISIADITAIVDIVLK